LFCLSLYLFALNLRSNLFTHNRRGDFNRERRRHIKIFQGSICWKAPSILRDRRVRLGILWLNSNYGNGCCRGFTPLFPYHRQSWVSYADRQVEPAPVVFILLCRYILQFFPQNVKRFYILSGIYILRVEICHFVVYNVPYNTKRQYN